MCSLLPSTAGEPQPAGLPQAWDLAVSLSPVLELGRCVLGPPSHPALAPPRGIAGKSGELLRVLQSNKCRPECNGRDRPSVLPGRACGVGGSKEALLLKSTLPGWWPHWWRPLLTPSHAESPPHSNRLSRELGLGGLSIHQEGGTLPILCPLCEWRVAAQRTAGLVTATPSFPICTTAPHSCAGPGPAFPTQHPGERETSMRSGWFNQGLGPYPGMPRQPQSGASVRAVTAAKACESTAGGAGT